MIADSQISDAYAQPHVSTADSYSVRDWVKLWFRGSRTLRNSFAKKTAPPTPLTAERGSIQIVQDTECRTEDSRGNGRRDFLNLLYRTGYDWLPDRMSWTSSSLQVFMSSQETSGIWSRDWMVRQCHSVSLAGLWKRQLGDPAPIECCRNSQLVDRRHIIFANIELPLTVPCVLLNARIQVRSDRNAASSVGDRR